MSELNRDAFEAWAIRDAAATGKALKFERGGEWYLGKDHQVMNLGWAAWQASREELVIQLPAEEPGYMYYAPDMVTAIEAAGLKVKP